MPPSTPTLLPPPAVETPKLFSAGHFRTEDRVRMLGWIRRYPFGTLMTIGAEGLRATSLPFVIDEDAEAGGDSPIHLVGHLAARNPHAAELATVGSALVVINSPSAYISPRWYAGAANVPTWNYVGIQVRGPIEVLPGAEARRQVLERTASAFERAATPPWQLSDAPAELVERLLGGIVAFRIGPCALECIEKLGQNKPGADFTGTIAGLRAAGDEMSAAVAHLMTEVMA